MVEGDTVPRRDPSARRWGLWAALVLLVLVLLMVLVFLAREYEEGRDQQALDQESATVVGDIRNALLRNVQTLQALHAAWPPPPDIVDHRGQRACSRQHREMAAASSGATNRSDWA